VIFASTTLQQTLDNLVQALVRSGNWTDDLRDQYAAASTLLGHEPTPELMQAARWVPASQASRPLHLSIELQQSEQLARVVGQTIHTLEDIGLWSDENTRRADDLQPNEPKTEFAFATGEPAREVWRYTGATWNSYTVDPTHPQIEHATRELELAGWLQDASTEHIMRMLTVFAAARPSGGVAAVILGTFEHLTSETPVTAQKVVEEAGLLDSDADYGGVPASEALLLHSMWCMAPQELRAEVRERFMNLVQYRALTPLTSDPDEWIDRTDMSGGPLWQNMRQTTTFSNDGGQTWWDVNDPARTNWPERSA
jgi:hypothetical protein